MVSMTVLMSGTWQAPWHWNASVVLGGADVREALQMPPADALTICTNSVHPSAFPWFLLAASNSLLATAQLSLLPNLQTAALWDDQKSAQDRYHLIGTKKVSLLLPNFFF